jgi:hypothetical protein
VCRSRLYLLNQRKQISLYPYFANTFRLILTIFPGIECFDAIIIRRKFIKHFLDQFDLARMRIDIGIYDHESIVNKPNLFIPYYLKFVTYQLTLHSSIIH